MQERTIANQFEKNCKKQKSEDNKSTFKFNTYCNKNLQRILVAEAKQPEQKTLWQICLETRVKGYYGAATNSCIVRWQYGLDQRCNTNPKDAGHRSWSTNIIGSKTENRSRVMRREREGSKVTRTIMQHRTNPSEQSCPLP